MSEGRTGRKKLRRPLFPAVAAEYVKIAFFFVYLTVRVAGFE